MAAMSTAEMREFIDKVMGFEQGKVTPAPWALLKNREGNMRTRAVSLGRIDHQLANFVTADGSYTHYDKIPANVDFLLYLRNNIVDFIGGVEAGDPPDASATYYPSPANIKKAYVALNSVVRLGGIEEMRYVLERVDSLLQPIIGNASSAPYTATNVSGARTALASLRANIPSREAVDALTDDQKKTLLTSLVTGVKGQLSKLTDPGDPAVPTNPSPTMVHYADLLLRSLAGDYYNAYQKLFAPWRNKYVELYAYTVDPETGEHTFDKTTEWDNLTVDQQAAAKAAFETEIKQGILDKITQAADYLKPMDYVESCEPYVAAEVAAARTALLAIVTAGTTQTFEAIQAAIDALAPTFAKGYVPMDYVPTEWIGRPGMNGHSTAGTQFTSSSHV